MSISELGAEQGDLIRYVSRLFIVLKISKVKTSWGAELRSFYGYDLLDIEKLEVKRVVGYYVCEIIKKYR